MEHFVPKKTIKGRLIIGESIKTDDGYVGLAPDNPYDGRLMFNDHTFYSRLLFHLESCQANCPMGQEELEYLRRRAKDLQEYQIKTVEKDSDEYIYLKNLNLI